MTDTPRQARPFVDYMPSDEEVAALSRAFNQASTRLNEQFAALGRAFAVAGPRMVEGLRAAAAAEGVDPALLAESSPGRDLPLPWLDGRRSSDA